MLQTSARTRLSSVGQSRSTLGLSYLLIPCHIGLILAILPCLLEAILVFSGGPQCSYSMQPWRHLGNLALSFSSHLWASSKSSCFFYCAIFVFSGDPPMFALDAPFVLSWPSCFVFESPSWFFPGAPNVLTPCHLGAILAILLCLGEALVVPAPNNLLSSLGPSWSYLDNPHFHSRCHLGLILAILLSL